MRLTSRGGRRRLAVRRATTRGQVDSRRWGRKHTRGGDQGKEGGAVQVAADLFFWHDFRWSQSGNLGIVHGVAGFGDAERYEDWQTTASVRHNI